MKLLPFIIVGFLIGCTPDSNQTKPEPSSKLATLLTEEQWAAGWEVWANAMLGSQPCIIIQRESFDEAHHATLVSSEIVKANGKKTLMVRVEKAVGVQTKNTLSLTYECDVDQFDQVIIVLPSGKSLEFNNFVKAE